MTFDLPLAVTNAIDTLESAGYEAYAVGGCVRDLCRGVVPHDYDITTSATPDEIESCFTGHRIIETGIKHGTVTVIMDEMPLEITTFRTDGEYLDNRHPSSVSFSHRIGDDLSRRDFTVNAMAYSPSRGLCDPFGGREHIESRTIACVGDPDVRFSEDGLRIMRALRFASCLGFNIDAATAGSIHKNRLLLSNISAERILSEFKRLITGDGAHDVLTGFGDVIAVIMPEVSGSGYADAVDAVSQSRCDIPLRTSLLLRSPAALPALRRLKPDGKLLASVKCILTLAKDGFDTDDISLRRLLRHVSYDDAVRAVEFLSARGRMGGNADTVITRLRDMESRGECVTPRGLAISGHDLIALGASEGEEVGRALEMLLEAVITGRTENEKAALIQFYKGAS